MRADRRRFERRGGLGCSNSDYHFRRTTCCNSYCIEDEELHNLFFDPQDLTKKVVLYDDQPCPLCGSDVWDFVDADDLEAVPEVRKWACLRG